MPSPSPARRYPSDLTDAQWELIAPLLPPPKALGRREKHDRRDIVNAILYVLRTGCAWRYLPKDFPPWETVFWYFRRWRTDGTVDRVHDALRDRVRDAAGRDPMASAGIIDSQSVKGSDTVGKPTVATTRAIMSGGWLCRLRCCGLCWPRSGGGVGEQAGITLML
jgi:transposase